MLALYLWQFILRKQTPVSCTYASLDKPWDSTSRPPDCGQFPLLAPRIISRPIRSPVREPLYCTNKMQLEACRSRESAGFLLPSPSHNPTSFSHVINITVSEPSQDKTLLSR